MVRRWSPSLSSAEQHHNQQQGEDPISFYDVDSCFVDHFYDFDPIKEWLVDPDHNPMPDVDNVIDCSDGLESGNFELGLQDSIFPASIGEKMEKVSLAESQMDPNGDDGKIIQVLEAKMEVGVGVPNALAAEMKTGDGCIDEVKINDVVGDVCLATDPIKAADKTEEEESSEESDEESEDSSSESSSSSSSSGEDESSSSDEEEVANDDGGEKEVLAEIEVEEGEINGDDLEEFILGCDGEEEITKGPIKSKHEIEDLPPVPPLEVSLEPHHQTLPVGFVSSILGNRVIVEGSEKHSPLNEGSILWITEIRSPLGIIDEIFGPVKNPYYIVRYNSDKEVPSGVCVSVAVSFVVDFANHILNEKYLYQKGYDASGNDDEEVTDEAEFSDDEKEAEYRRSLRQNKRNANSGNQESGSGKKGAGFRDKQLHLPHSLPVRAVNLPRPSCHDAREPANSGSVAPSSSVMPDFPSQPQAFQMGISSALGTTVQQLSVGSVQGFPQAHAMGIQGGFPPFPQFMGMQGGGPPLNWFPSQQVGGQISNLQHQAQVFNNYAGGMMPYQQQQQYLVPCIGAIPGSFPWVTGLTNPSIDPSSALTGLVGQGGFSQVPFGWGNVNPQGSLALGNEQNQCLPPPAVNQGDVRPSSTHHNIGQFNRGRSSSRGRRPYQRGGHRSFGRGGSSQQNG